LVAALAMDRGCAVWGWRAYCRLNKSQVTTINLAFTPLVSLLAGILILVMPRLLNYIVAIYLIVIGLVGIFGTGNFTLRF